MQQAKYGPIAQALIADIKGARQLLDMPIDAATRQMDLREEPNLRGGIVRHNTAMSLRCKKRGGGVGGRRAISGRLTKRGNVCLPSGQLVRRWSLMAR